MNTPGSTISRESDAVILTHAGPEIAVASTKAFTAQVTACYILGLYLAQVRGNKYADEIAAIKAAKDAGSKQAPSDELAALWKLQRNAQFYWDFVMVENSEGAHNPDLTFETLDKAEAAADQALSMLG